MRLLAWPWWKHPWQDPAHGYLDVYLNRSEDGGATWLEEPVRVNASPPGAVGSRNVDAALLGEGLVGLVWDSAWDGMGARSVFFNRYSAENHAPPVAAPPPEAVPTTDLPAAFGLANEHVDLQWQREGTRLHLTRVVPKAAGIAVNLGAGSGDWQVVFRAKGVDKETVEGEAP